MKKKVLLFFSSIMLILVVSSPVALASTYSSTYSMYHGVMASVCVNLNKGDIVTFKTTPNKYNKAKGKYKIGTHLYADVWLLGMSDAAEGWNYAHIPDSSKVTAPYKNNYYFYLENQSDGYEFFSGNVIFEY